MREKLRGNLKCGSAQPSLFPNFIQGGGGDMDLKVPTGGKVERRQSQEFRNLCVKFDEKEGGGVGNDVRRKPESNPSRG